MQRKNCLVLKRLLELGVPKGMAQLSMNLLNLSVAGFRVTPTGSLTMDDCMRFVKEKNERPDLEPCAESAPDNEKNQHQS